MYFLYSLALSTTFLVLLPYFVYQAVKHGKYVGNLKQRFGSVPPIAEKLPVIWVHTVSVGEFLAAQPLIERLASEFPSYRLVVSTTTTTGQRLARERLGRGKQTDNLFYFPFDWAFSVRRALNRVNPALVVLLETELWPNFLRECRRRRITTVVANGRISRRSFRGYARIKPFISRVLADISLLIMQSADDRDRALALGASPERLRICGNIKYDITIEDESDDRRTAPLFERLIGLRQSAPLIVAGSTAEGEERLLLEALGLIRTRPSLSESRLVIAPRRPERFDEVASMIAGSGFGFVRRSEGEIAFGAAAEAVAPVDAGIRNDVILLDSIGELASIYRFASVVFVGGSMVPRGGHNVLEAAAHAKPIVVGPYTDNFKAIISDFAQAGGLIQLRTEQLSNPAAALAESIVQILSDAGRAETMGSKARELLRRNRGATDCIVTAISSLLSGDD